MRSILLLALMLPTFIVEAQTPTDWANFGKYAAANKTIKSGTVVFMGNSITEGWAAQHPDFFKNNHYTGRGISGQTSSQMLVRFRQDVVDLKPIAVVILAGTNDIAQNTGYISLENILGNIISMVELAKANHIKPILCSVLPAYQFGWRKELQPADDIIKLNNMIKAYAQKNYLPYIDYHAALKDDRNGLPEKYAKDGVHPTDAAYRIMEQMVKPVIHKTVAIRKKKK